jgi:hypothetical protein
MVNQFYIDGNPEHPLNKGVICAKGSSNRLLPTMMLVLSLCIHYGGLIAERWLFSQKQIIPKISTIRELLKI